MMCNNFRGSEDAGNLLTSSEVVYSERQKIFLRGRGKEDRNKFLKLVISIVTVVNPVSAKSLSIQITDEEDPFVLYNLVISDADFQTIKEQQGLLIEYDKFPQQLIKLLHLCNSDVDDGVNYHLVIEEIQSDKFGFQQTQMKIIETNQFKQLYHLSLAINVGNDMEIKKHMAVQLKIMKESLNLAETKATQAETVVEDLTKKLEEKNREMDHLHERWCEENKFIHQQTKQEVNIEREKLAQAQEELRKSLETEKKLFQELLSQSKKDYENLLSELRSENKILFEENRESESKLRELNAKLDLLLKENFTLQRDASHLRSQSAKLDSEYHDKEKSLSNLKVRFAVLEQELRDKDSLLAQQRELLRVAQEQKILLEENLSEKETIIQKRQNSLQTLSEEFMKGNEIIQKLQMDNTTLKSKLKLRTNIALEQEGILLIKEKEITSLHSQGEDQQRKLIHLETRQQQLTQLLNESNAKLAKQETTLSNNTNLINWLNRRINELQTPLQTQPSSKAPTVESRNFTSTPHFTFTPILNKTVQVNNKELHLTQNKNVPEGLLTQHDRPSIQKKPDNALTNGVRNVGLKSQDEVVQGKNRITSKFLTPSSYFPQSSSK